MKTLSKLTTEDLENPKAFFTCPELQTEYRIVKIKPAVFTRYYLQFRDNYRVMGIKTPIRVWRFIPRVEGKWHKHECPIRSKPFLFSLFVPHMVDPNNYVFIRHKSDKRYLKKFAQVYPIIEFHLDELERIYRKKNGDNVEYL